MRRSLSVFLWILLGACTTSIGMGYVLLQARAERYELHTQIRITQEQSKTLAADHERLMREADQRIAAALAETKRAKEIVERRDEEQTLLAQATPLLAPTNRTLKSWHPFISVPVGISLHIPPNTVAAGTEQSIISMIGGSTGRPGEQWLTILPYKETTEKELKQLFQESSPVQFSVGRYLLVGQKGTRTSFGGTSFLLRIQRDGQFSHLIWARTTSDLPETKIRETLATITVAS